MNRSGCGAAAEAEARFSALVRRFGGDRAATRPATAREFSVRRVTYDS